VLFTEEDDNGYDKKWLYLLIIAVVPIALVVVIVAVIIATVFKKGLLTDIN
jgi:t-SNARE complex subunit (syntaxin)